MNKFYDNTLLILMAMLIYVVTNIELHAQEAVITGTVSDEEGNPIPGTNVLKKGDLQEGTVTDTDGRFTISTQTGDVLVISSIGFRTKEVQVGSLTKIDIVLIEDIQMLDELVVIGYGNQKRSSVTAAVSQIDVSEIKKMATHDASLTLEGRTPGVRVLTEGGIAGAEATVIIRGVSTFGNAQPLFVIDGAFSTSGLTAVNPQDIESIEILKDGSAAAIYGSRAANGVVLVTTKRGKKGAPKIDILTSVGIQTPSKTLDYLNADQWRQFANQVSDNSGIPRAPENENPNLSRGVDTDWQDLWIENAPILITNANISGGGENTTYNVSFGYLNQGGILKFSNFDKYNLRSNFSYRKGKWEISENIGIAYWKNTPNNSFSVGGSTGDGGFHIPTVPNRDSDGNFVAGGPDFYLGNSTVIPNKYAQASYEDREIGTFNLTGDVSISYEILEGLKYRLSFSGSYNNQNDFAHNIPYSVSVLGAPELFSGRLNPSFSEILSRRFDYTIDNLLTYDKYIGKHQINALMGYSRYSENFRSTGTTAIFENEFEQQLRTLNSTGLVSGEELKALLISYFGRLNYDFDNRYLLSLSIRNDKSSKFAPENRSELYPSISAGWNIQNEDFFPSNGIVSQLKIRGGYGELGVSSIKPYQYSSVAYGPIPAIFGLSQNGPGDRSFGRVTQLADPNLRWEKSKSVNFGLELGFLQDALTFVTDYFVRKNTDLLAEVPLAPSVGQTININQGTRPVINSAEVENKGWEFLVNYNNSKHAFKYNVSFNLTALKNEVIKLGEDVQPILGSLMSGSFDDRPTRTDVGYPIGSFYGYMQTGIDQTTGDFIFQDTNNDEIVNAEDKVVLGDAYPDFTYGFNFDAEFKGFDFAVFFVGQKGGEIFSQIKYINYFLYNSNVVTEVLDSWTPENTDSSLPIAKSPALNNVLPSSFYVEDASYLRLGNLQVGYNLSRLFENFRLDGSRIFFGIQNLFTISNYSGYDPEVSTNALFDRGVDFRGFPNARTFTLGLNLSL